MFNNSLPPDLERQSSGPKVGEHFYINKEDVTVSDLSQGVTTAIAMAVDDQVYLNQTTLNPGLEDQVHIVGLDRLDQNEDEGSGSEDTIDPDEPMPLMKLPPISRESSMSSLTNDMSRAYMPGPTGNYTVSRMMDESAIILSENEASFDERYTYNHPPFAQPDPVSNTGADWPSTASTRTPAEDKIAIDMLSPGQHCREIGSIGYLKDLTRGPDTKTVVSSGKNSKSSRCSIGFMTYAHDRYVHSSQTKKILIWAFFGALSVLLIVSLVVGFVESDRRIDNSDPLTQQLPQQGNVPPLSTDVDNVMTDADVLATDKNIAPGVFASDEVIGNDTSTSTTILPATLDNPISQNEFEYRGHGGLTDSNVPSISPIDGVSDSSFPTIRSTESVMTVTPSPSKQELQELTQIPTHHPTASPV